MKLSTTLSLFAVATSAFAWQDATDGTTSFSIYAYGINASFIGYGARITNLFIHDKANKPIDVVVGYDDPAMYIYDNNHNRTYFGAVVGRYANRIKNGTFTIDGEQFHIPENEHNGQNTLHGGFIGYDNRNWTMVQRNESSITWSLYDDSGSSGFPGTVINYATYTVVGSINGSPSRLVSRLVSIPLDHKTPIMLANHIYWNLNAFAVSTILNDTMQLPYAARTIDTDSIQIPTGGLSSVKYPWQSPPVPLNFTGPKQVYEGSLYSQQCGTGCTGIDNAYIIDRPATESPDSLASPQIIYNAKESGITMKTYTNQGGLQVYTCVGQNGTIANKASQQANGVKTVDKYGCIVFETQQYIDGMNNPQWGNLDNEIFSGTTLPAVNLQIYEFTISS